jgi:integrase
VSLGRYGVLTVQQARKQAQDEISRMTKGIDPVMEKKRTEAYSLTLRQITDDYLRDRRDLKPSSRKDILKHLKNAFSSWADRPAIEITRDKVIARFRELTERGPAQANQAFRNLRAIMNYARAAYRPNDEPLIIENPVSVLSDTKMWNKVRARSGRIATDKIGLAWNLLRGIRDAPGETVIAHTLADALSFLLLTGARWGEMAALTWDRVNLHEGCWYIPDPKNRQPITFPLSKITRDILTNRLNTSQYVFPARSKDGHIHDARGHFEKISKAVGTRITAHDLRRTFRAVAGECDIELWKTKLLMNHKLSGDVTISHYTETQDLRYLRAEINKIADWITRQGMIAVSDKVVPFPTERFSNEN